MNHSELIRELDATISTYVIARDAGCVTCGAKTDLTASHFIHRGKKSVKYVEANIFCQCASCNRTHNHNQGPLTIVFFSRYTWEHYHQLEGKARELSHFKEYQLQELLHEWKEKLSRILTEAGLSEEGVNLLKYKSELKVSEL